MIIDLLLNKKNFSLRVNTALNAEGITTLFGASGSGKTTLLRTLAGLEGNATGSIQFKTATWLSSKRKISVPTYQRGIGFVFQNKSLFEHLTVEGNLHYAQKRAFSNTFAFDHITRLLNIGHLLKRRVTSLSGGESQKVAIARALMSNPCCLFMDEPTSQIDIQAKQEILQLIKKIPTNFNIPIFYITHSLDEVISLSDEVLLIKDGRAQGPYTLDKAFCPQTTPIDTVLSIIEATIYSHQPEFAISELRFGHDNILKTPLIKGQGKVKIVVKAHEVSIALTKQTDSSILNILPATIISLFTYKAHQTGIKLNVGGQEIFAIISAVSEKQLGLKKGMQVFAQIKAMSLSLY